MLKRISVYKVVLTTSILALVIEGPSFSSEQPEGPIKELPGELISSEFPKTWGEKEIGRFGAVCTDFKRCMEEARRTRTLHLKTSELTDDNLAQIKLYADFNLQVDQENFDEATLKRIGQLTNLRALNLSRIELRDEWLAHLKGLVNLEVLILGLTGITDAGLVHLEGLTKLNTLFLVGTNVTGSGFASLTRLVNLRSLQLGNTKIDDAGLTNIKNFPNLEGLILSGTQITSLSPLSELVKLRNLSLGSTRIGDNGIIHLKNLINLMVLDVNGTQVGNSSLLILSQLPNLTNLSIINTNINDEGLIHMERGGFSKLTQLEIGTNITRRGLNELWKFPNLQRIMLRKSEDLTDEDIQGLKGRLPKLELHLY